MPDLIQNLCIVCLNACLFDISINVANPCLNKNLKCLLETCPFVENLRVKQFC